MIIKATFTHNGKTRTYKRDSNDLDRNYDDEPYALIIEKLPKSKYGIYEINVQKDDESGKLIESDGYVAVYEDMDDCEPTELIDAQIEFING